MTKAEARIVPIEVCGQTFRVAPDGNIMCDYPRVSPNLLDEVRIAASEIFLIEKKHEISREERNYWRAVGLIRKAHIH